jgi:hypothetical protein
MEATVNAIAFEGVNEQPKPGYTRIKITFAGLFGEIVSMSTPENVIGWPTTKAEGEMFTVSTVPKTGETANPNARKRNKTRTNPIILDISLFSHNFPSRVYHALCRRRGQEITLKFTQPAPV